MSPLLSILRATHCRSTHHFFAIDALRLVETDAGQRFRGILLKHHDRYLTGAKDPDVRFRDFQNHVIHVQDGYFGGAPRLAIQWYDRLMGHLVASRWEDAAYAAGVLSHYFTDPLMPLHTAQSERETLVHRPMEWSICKSYDRILKIWTSDELRLVFQLGDGDGWLGEAILKGARVANRSYKRLVDTYNVDLGVENPVAGLDDDALHTFAELFGLAITGLARIFERAAEESEARTGHSLPSTSLTIPALLATLQIPEQLWIKRIEDKHERRAIEALVAEYRVTGQIKDNLPQEIYIKQQVLKVREREAVWNNHRRELALAKGAKQTQIVEATASAESLPHVLALPVRNSAAESKETKTIAQQPAAGREKISPSIDPSTDDIPISIPFPTSAKLSTENSPRAASTLNEPVVHNDRLRRSQELSHAPSIGPKTATAFAQINIRTIGEFLDAEAPLMARRLGKSWITAVVIETWQTQTSLMCQVPGLLSRDVQMLVGIGCRTCEQLAQSKANELVVMMNRYALSSEGRRSLRGAEPANTAAVERWIKNASQATLNRRAA